jgi:hypothetical protein
MLKSGVTLKLIDTKREKALATRARRNADMRACRKRQNAGIALFYLAADESTYDMMVHLGLLDPAKVSDKEAVRTALGKLLRRGLEALLELEARGKKR